MPASKPAKHLVDNTVICGCSMSMQMNLVSNLMQISLNGWLLYLRSDVGYRLSWTFVSFMWVAVLLTGLVRLYILGILSILNN